MIGREPEVAAVATFLGAAPPPGPRALVLAGVPGIGKTTILRDALLRASATDVRALVARPAAGEQELPFSALGDLLAALPEDAFATLPQPQQSALAAALGRGESGGAVDEHLVARGVLGLLERESAGGGLVLVVDDAQWLDRPSGAVLAFALRRIDPAPIRVLVATRAEAGAPAELPLGLAGWSDVRRVGIGPLSTTEVGALLRERLELRLPRPRVEAIREASGGNPLLALELARAGEGTRETLATTLPAALEARLAALDEDTREVLGFAAAALRPSPELLFRAGVERSRLEAALATSLLEAERERLWFSHPALGTAAYGLLEPGMRRQVHARLAAASSNAVERGHHVARSLLGRDDGAAQLLDDAADEAARLGDHAGAAAFLVKAAEATVEREGDAAHERELRAADELELAGDVRGAASLAQDLLPRLTEGVARARARRTFVWASIGDGLSYEAALDEFALAVADAEGDERVQAGLRLSMGEICCGLCRLDEAVQHTRAAIELAERSGDVATATTALAQLGFAESMLGLGVTDSARQALARWDGTLGASSPPQMELACALLHAAEFDEAARLFESVIALAQEQGVEAVEVVARAHLAETQLRAGRWAEALVNSRSAVEHARQAAIGQIVTGVSYALAMTQALLGQHDEARRVAGEALADAEATQDFWFRISHRAVLGLVALAEDDPEAAVDVLEPAWELMIEQRLGDLSIFPIAPLLAESLATVGRLADALAVAATLRASPVGGGAWCRAVASRSEALVASAQGDHAAARTLVAAALEAHDDLAEPFEHARTLALAGGIERRARSWGSARALLVDALDRFDELGAARWAERAAAQIARLPGRRPADGQALTTRELDVAALVAAGLTNKEVAARLFLSLSTVEANLSKVYAKLAVRSRSELAGRLRR